MTRMTAYGPEAAPGVIQPALGVVVTWLVGLGAAVVRVGGSYSVWGGSGLAQGCWVSLDWAGRRRLSSDWLHRRCAQQGDRTGQGGEHQEMAANRVRWILFMAVLSK